MSRQGTAGRRGVAALIAVAIIAAGCSSDDDDPPATTEAPGTTDAAPGTTEVGGELTGEGLAVGLLTPSPGLLSTLFLGQERGASLAADDIDAGGGVLEGPLTPESFPAEPGGEPGANVTAAADAGVTALLGPPGSSDAAAVREQLNAADSTACSASATVPSITRDQERLELFRTAIPDDVSATYLASQIIARRDEAAPGAAWKVAIVARGDDYGYSVGGTLAAILLAAGLQPSVVDYNPRRVIFEGEAAEVAALAPDATILVTYSEGANLLSALINAGIAPATMIGLDAFFAPQIAGVATASSEPTAIDGFQMLGSMGNKAFLDRLIEDNPNGQVANAPQAYDCAVVLALSTAVVANGDAATIGEAAISVTGTGVTCTTYADCLEKLNAGEDINYDGVSGQIQLDENGDPTFARFTSGAFVDGVISDVTSVDVNIRDIRRQQEAYAAANLITKIQQALTFLGFYTGPIDGLDSEEFRAALAAFQASVGLPPTGIFDAATDEALRAALGPYAELLTTSTADVQRLMTDLGFYTGPIDGIWNDELTDSIKALQRELGVPETGILDAATLRAVYARGVEDGTPTTTTAPPDTTAPPETTAPPVTAPPTTAPPETAPPTTAPPVTAPPTTEPPPDPSLPTLLDALRAEPELSDYVRLLEAAGFPDDFDRLAQYTVFAPSNDAFEPGQVDALLADNDPTEIFNLLIFYAAEGDLSAADVAALTDILMIAGDDQPVVVDGATVRVGGAAVTRSIEAFNGYIHVLDSLFATA